MKSYLSLFAVVLLTGISNAQTEGLPAESKELVQKLADWKVEKQIELKKEIEEKQNSVVIVLNEQLADATKRGDLDGAIAIRMQIEKLTPVNPQGRPSGPSGASNFLPLEKLTEKALIGTKWIYPYRSRTNGPGEMLFEFKKDQKTYVMFRKAGGKWEFHMDPTWDIVDDWVVETFSSGTEVKVSNDLQKMTWKGHTAVRYDE